MNYIYEDVTKVYHKYYQHNEITSKQVIITGIDYEPELMDYVIKYTDLKTQKTGQLFFETFMENYTPLEIIEEDETDEEPVQEVGIKYDKGKLQLSLIEPNFIEGIAKVLTQGAETYGERNWQKVDRPEKRYLDALQRHLLAYSKGIKTDSESGLSHLYHIATNVMFLAYFDDNRIIEDTDTTGVNS